MIKIINGRNWESRFRVVSSYFPLSTLKTTYNEKTFSNLHQLAKRH